MLIGTWDGGGRAARAIYGTMVMTKDRISWGKEKSDPGCEAHYAVIAKDYADTFPDQDEAFRRRAKGRMYNITKIKLTQQTCVERIAYLQFAFPSDIAGYVDVVEYDETDHHRFALRRFKLTTVVCRAWYPECESIVQYRREQDSILRRT